MLKRFELKYFIIGLVFILLVAILIETIMMNERKKKDNVEQKENIIKTENDNQLEEIEEEPIKQPNVDLEEKAADQLNPQ